MREKKYFRTLTASSEGGWGGGSGTGIVQKKKKKKKKKNSDRAKRSPAFLKKLILVSVLLCFCARLFIDAFWSPGGKGMTSWLSLVMSNCEIVTFPLVSWVRCGA